ncbi:MAG: hypothetical protein KDE01_32225, partial [Caldilineaceae bacterium]|nr:hypothetical protein [Caldilineaceae bacterium]
ATDVTEARRLEEQLRQAQKMEALGVLAGGIAHDFNNLLTPIVSYTELMLGRAEAGSREQRYLGQIRKAAERATELVRQILAFSRTRQAAVGAADVCACVDEVLDLLRPTLPSTIELLRQCDLPDAYVLADSHEIVQVIMNLCTNAYQAIGEAPGRIIVRVERVPGAALAPPVAATDSASPPEWVRLTVQDSGDGIDPEAREHLFEPFFTTKGAGKGTGLGLPVVYGIVRKLGGRIDFESTPGRGTSFVMESAGRGRHTGRRGWRVRRRTSAVRASTSCSWMTMPARWRPCARCCSSMATASARLRTGHPPLPRIRPTPATLPWLSPTR